MLNKTQIDLREWEGRDEQIGTCEKIIERDIDDLEHHCHAESTIKRATDKLERDRKYLETAKTKKFNLEQKMENLKNTDGVFTIHVKIIDYGGYDVEGHKDYVFSTYEEAMNFYKEQPKNGYYVYYLEYETVEDYVGRLEEQKAVYLQRIAELDEEIRKVFKG